jgi:hypothetical protein
MRVQFKPIQEIFSSQVPPQEKMSYYQSSYKKKINQFLHWNTLFFEYKVPEEELERFEQYLI